VLDRLEAELAGPGGVVAALAVDGVRRCRELTSEANRLEREITTRVKPLAASLLAIAGCGALTAAKLLGETAGVARFTSRHAFARHNGTAPIPVSSGNSDHHRLNRGGNRQINAAIHRIAITQLQAPGPARHFIETRMAAGKTKKDALRLLRRRLSDVVYRAMLTDTRIRPAHQTTHLEQAA
jgi:transposase